MKTKLLSPFVRRFAHISGASAFLALRQGAPRILMLHAVGSQEHISSYSQILNLYPATVFEAELRYLAHNFKIVPLKRIIERFQEGDLGRSHEIALTFDDGLCNNATIGYSILRRLRLPATFFVCPGLIESGGWQWSYEVAARLNHLAPSLRSEVSRELGAPTDDTLGVLGWMKSLETSTRLIIEGRLRAATYAFAPTAEEHHLFDTMTWKHLRSLDPDLITVGSHSMNHPILSKTDEGQLAMEISGSRHILEKELQRTIEYFCYPDGTYDDRSLNLVRQHYRAAVSTRPAFISHTDDIHVLPRIGAGEEPVYDLAWRLHRPTS